MPELPELTVYVECLERLLQGQALRQVEIGHPFLLRSVEPAPAASLGARVTEVSRLGKRVLIHLEGELYWVIHLMIAGRLVWSPATTKPKRPTALARFHFPNGVLSLTEAGSERRASLHLVKGAENLAPFRRQGVEPLEVDFDRFAASLRSTNHTLKRALVDPDIISGIGNTYSDEILHRARLSPLARTQSLDDVRCRRLFDACQGTLCTWIERLRTEAAGAGFPQKVTAFHPEMAVHGKYKSSCPVCQSPVQRIVYAKNECNYCPTCQTDGVLLKDRSLSRLLHDDWPRSLAELEERRAGGSR